MTETGKPETGKPCFEVLQGKPQLVFKFGNGKTASTSGCVSLWVLGVKVTIYVLETPAYVPILLEVDFLEAINANVEIRPGRGTLSSSRSDQKTALAVLKNRHRALWLVGAAKNAVYSKRTAFA